jgi:hypothetical protein
VGTSQSSKGPGSGVPMVPPWAPPVPTEELPSSPDVPNEAPPVGPAAPTVAAPIAPPARFTGARSSLGAFAAGGTTKQLRRGLGHYVRSGYGGASTATRRSGGTVRGAGALYDALTALGGGGATFRGLDLAILRAQSADQVMDAVVEASNPIDGTLDREASRASTREALSDLLTKYPEADLMALTEEQKLAAVESYVALDVFYRLDLDVGQTIRDRAPDVTSAMARLVEVKDYIREAVANAFRTLRDRGHQLTRQGMARIVTAALKETFMVFEGYLA